MPRQVVPVEFYAHAPVSPLQEIPSHLQTNPVAGAESTTEAGTAMPKPSPDIISINIPVRKPRRRHLAPTCWSDAITDDSKCRYCGHHAGDHRAHALRYPKPQRNSRLPRYVTGMKILLCLTCAMEKATQRVVCLKTKPTANFKAAVARRQ